MHRLLAALLLAATACGPAGPETIVGPGDDRLRLRELTPIQADDRYLYFTADAKSSDRLGDDAGLWRKALDGGGEPEQVYSLPGLRRGFADGDQILLVATVDDGSRIVSVTTLGQVELDLVLPGYVRGATRAGDDLLVTTWDRPVVRYDASGAELVELAIDCRSEMLVEDGDLYCVTDLETVSRIAIDGSETAATLLTSSYFTERDDYLYTVGSRLLAVRDGEPVVATSVYENDVDMCGDCTDVYVDGAVHTVGTGAQILTDSIVVGDATGDLVLGLGPDGDGAWLDLSDGSTGEIDRRLDPMRYSMRLLAAGDRLYIGYDDRGGFWDRIDAMQLGAR